MLNQKDNKKIRSKLDNIYKISLSREDIDKFENEIICDNFVNKFEIDKFSEITKQGKFNQ